MYNKISPIILNTGRSNGTSDVFIAQPDALKESLAGKIFVLAEIEGKKNDSRRVFDFLIASLENYYYNDEKIILRDKIEGLKVENIFEAALAKSNKALAEFLNEEKIKLNPNATNITLGVVFENKIHFSNFGRNRAILVYSRQQQHEIINIEANATDSEESRAGIKNDEKVKAPKLFSSVISGEVPESSYFVFTSEALPEYLSDKELVNIITKLPPIVASEQIKNTLTKINSHVPFLGIIIKSTLGSVVPEIEERIDNLSAQSSISALNHTEQRTEKMLSPAGLIDLRKIIRKSGTILENFGTKKNSPDKERGKKKDAIELKTISLDTDSKKLKLPRTDSFLIKDKIFFRKDSNWFWLGLKKVFSNLPRIFSNLSFWIKTSNMKNRLLFSVLILVVVIFSLSLLITNINNKRQLARQQFTDLVTQIEDKEDLITSHLLYNDEEGAKMVLVDIHDLLATLPQKKKEQKEAYDNLVEKISYQEEKIQKIVRVDELEKIADLSGLSINSIIWANNQLYTANSNSIYKIDEGNSVEIELGGINLNNPYFDGKEQIYYWDNNRVIQFNVNNQKSIVLEVTSLVEEDAVASYKVFNNNLYTLSQGQNQIHKYLRSGDSFNTKSSWLQDQLDLSRATDIGIDGDIYLLNNNGEVLNLFKGQKQEYSASSLLPETSSATKLIVGEQYLYILITDSKRIVVLAKQDGHLINQYQMDTLDNFRDIAIDEKGQAAYVLNGDIVYRVRLGQ